MIKTNRQEYQLTIEQTREGVPTIAIRDYSKRKLYLHSRFFPSRESEAFKDKFNPDKFDIAIVLGVGLGYHLRYIKETINRYNKIILIEKLNNLENEIDKIPDTRFLCHHPRIAFLSGQSIKVIEKFVSEEIDFDTIKGISIIEHPPSMRAFPGYYQEIRRVLERIISKKASNKATKKAFGWLYVSNILKNLSTISEHYPVSSFFNSFNEYPAMLITTGPSLEQHINKVKEHQNNAFIVSVDSALPLLKSSNITPDFCISVDPQKFITEHFIGINSGYVLVFSLSSNPTILSDQRGLLSLNSHPISQIIEQLYPSRIGSIDSTTGSVAGDAINLARLFGFKHIGLLGYDFSFLDYKIYSRGTAYQNRFSLYYHDRLNPIETQNLNYIMKASSGFTYKNRFSRRSFIHYKESLETMIQGHGIKDIYNINHAGIPIESVPNTDLQAFLNSYCTREINKAGIIQNAFNETEKIKNCISMQRIKDVLSKEDALIAIMNASVDQSLGMYKINKIKHLISQIH